MRPGMGRRGRLFCPTLIATIDRDFKLSVAHSTAGPNQAAVFSINVSRSTGAGLSTICNQDGDAVYTAGEGTEIMPWEVDFAAIRTARERGLRALGQPLKSFRDHRHDFAHYDLKKRSPAFDALGALKNRSDTMRLLPLALLVAALSSAASADQVRTPSESELKLLDETPIGTGINSPVGNTERTWINGVAYYAADGALAAGAVREHLNALRALPADTPLLIYMHGCSGLDIFSRNSAKYYAELDLAISRIRELRGPDTPIVLHDLSEAAIAVAAYQSGDCGAFMQSDCHQSVVFAGDHPLSAEHYLPWNFHVEKQVAAFLNHAQASDQ